MLDTEGLQSPERIDNEYDRKIVLFAMLSSDILIINNKGEINSNMDLVRLVGLKLFEVYGTYSVCQWIKKYMLDWINEYTDLEDIISGNIKCKFNSKINGIKLIKRNYYLNKYYYF